MKKLFTLILSLVFLLSCDGKTLKSADFIDIKLNFVATMQEKTEKIELPNIVDYINSGYNYFLSVGKKIIEKEISLCEESVLFLKEEWNNSFCDVLRDEAKEDCLKQREAVPSYVKELCTITVAESFRTNIDWLLVLAVMKNESNFGIIKKKNDEYYVSQDVCEREINKRNVGTTTDDCKKDSARRIEFISSGNRVCVYILSETKSKYIINTCLHGEAGVLQLITPNYYSRRVIPGTEETIPDGSTLERRMFINENLEASIKIGIDELIIHRDIFPERERVKWWSWISCYNIGSTNRCSKQWRVYSTKILKNYSLICQNESVRNYFSRRCDDLNNYIYWWDC
jgi:hypothetical protein